MITKEAVELYLDRLAEGGVMAFHISNRNIDLKPVLAAIVRELGLVAIYEGGKKAPDAPEGIKEWIQPSIWVVVARNASAVEALKAKEGWADLPKAGDEAAWTDDFSNIFMSLIAVRKLRDPLSR